MENKMSKKFKIGDKVVAYKGIIRSIGIIEKISKTYGLLVEGTYYHPKQCRHLKPKRKPRRVWVEIPNYSIKSSMVWFNKQDAIRVRYGDIQLVEFVEVLKKNKNK
jgi:hypothetical protein